MGKINSKDYNLALLPFVFPIRRRFAWVQQAKEELKPAEIVKI